ncbi:MAG: alpha-glucan family phosphorylase [Chloroflexi bacterium]|nr:alpha-glucan family phosphorylase [Chloroflexota bacterium]
MIRPVTTVEVSPKLPPELKPLLDLAYNLRWSWDHESVELFRRLDGELWIRSNYNPVWMLGLISQQTLDAAARDTSFLNQLKRVVDSFNEYMESPDTWYQRTYGKAEKANIAYFSMEFGLTTALQTYSGGLGVLAGDHLKSASDLGIPLVGIGMLYQEGYFQQYLNQDGYQQESYPINDYANLPIRPVMGADGKRMVITVPLGKVSLYAYVWKVAVGRVNLYLLDANHPSNSGDLYNLTDRLYGGDRRTRIQQEILFGIGGIRMLEALNLRPQVIHMNEGHSAFSALERIRIFMKENPGVTFEEARHILATCSVYTIHTPVSAGLERFGYDLIDEYLTWLWQELGLTRDQFHDLGRERMGNYTLYSMPVMALKMSSATNAVSKLHGDVSQQMWQWLFPEVPQTEVPIQHVTNGVHVKTWVSRDMASLFDRYLDPSWRTNAAEESVWGEVDRIPDTEIWRVHERRRARLVAFARTRLKDQLVRRGMSQSEVESAEEVLNPEALTIGFARRFATYKRATLLFRDPVRLERILNNPDRPVQFIFAGKAHPHDQPGKEFIRQVVKFASTPEFRHSVVFLENYDMNMAHYLVQGVDVWLNNPRRPQEASGTSGMKVIYNAGLNCSILDGWWAEAYKPELGWAIGNGEEYSTEQEELQDYIESQALYNMFEKDIIPQFYDRGRDNLPREWIRKVKSSMKILSPFFNTDRMVEEYTTKYYLPSRERIQALTKDNLKEGKQYADWMIDVRKAWPNITIEKVNTSTEHITVGEALKVEAWVNLGTLKPDDVLVQLYSGSLDSKGMLLDGSAVNMEPDGKPQGTLYHFQASLNYTQTGEQGISVRVLPKHTYLADPILTGLIHWAAGDGGAK